MELDASAVAVLVPGSAGVAAVLLLPLGASEPEPVELDSAAGWSHEPVLQACCESPEQGAPPPDGAGVVQVRVCTPPLQGALHVDQTDHSPATGGR